MQRFYMLKTRPLTCILQKAVSVTKRGLHDIEANSFSLRKGLIKQAYKLRREDICAETYIGAHLAIDKKSLKSNHTQMLIISGKETDHQEVREKE